MPIVDEQGGQEGYLDGSHFVSSLLKAIVASEATEGGEFEDQRACSCSTY